MPNEQMKQKAMDWVKSHKAVDKWPKDFTKIKRVERKEDGHRVVIIKEAGKIRAYTRRGVNIWPKITNRFDLLYTAAPSSFMLDGELVHYGPASQLPTAINNPRAKLLYHLMAVPEHNGQPVENTWGDQLAAIASYSELRPALPIFPMRSYVTDAEPDRESWLVRAKNDGHEGFVFKETPFGPWYKLKPQYTVDMIVERVIEGAGKHKGRMGSLICRFADDHYFRVNVGGGFSDAEREQVYQKGAPAGVIEVKFQAVQLASLQFPRFVRFRPDKPANECSINQLEGVRRA